MHENEVKAIAEAVVKVLAERGLIKDGGCGCSAKDKAEPKAPPAFAGHTTGTAGKVFGSEWSPRRYGSISVPGDPIPAPGTAGRGIAPAEGDHTHSDDCPHCRAASGADAAGLRALGADRVGVCHPTKKSCGAIARMVDHTLLKPGATQEEVAKLCEEARAFCFASVCVNPAYVPLAAKLLKGSGVKVCTVVGFPLGSTTPTVKAIEARDAIANGADEIDMVLNVGALKSGNDALVREDIRAVREATRGRILKVILETALLSKDEKVRACRAAKEAGADFVKTSTGFGPGGATAEDIRLMRETVGPVMGVKASGGIRDTAAAKAMIEAGATRLGTSASVAIVTDARAEGKGY